MPKFIARCGAFMEEGGAFMEEGAEFMEEGGGERVKIDDLKGERNLTLSKGCDISHSSVEISRVFE